MDQHATLSTSPVERHNHARNVHVPGVASSAVIGSDKVVPDRISTVNDPSQVNVRRRDLAPDMLNVGFLAPGDPRDLRTWSGLPHFMMRSMEKRFKTLETIVPITNKGLSLLNGLGRVRRRLTGKNYPSHLNPLAVMAGRRRVRQHLQTLKPDVVVATTASTLLNAVPKNIPVIYFSDGTFRLLHGYYNRLSNLPKEAVRAAEQYEQEAIQRADILVYASDWAAQSAIRDYGADPDRTFVVPCGAGLPNPPPRRSDPKTLKAPGELHLLTIGVEWQRKGMDIATETIDILRARGIEAYLTIVGGEPPDGQVTATEGVTIISYLSKKDPEQLRTFQRLFEDSDVFLLASRAECSAVVFCEAAAYSLPLVGRDTGGVGTVVADGMAGALVPSDANGEHFADAVVKLTADPERYAQYAAASRKRFEDVLNWNAWSDRIVELAVQLVEAKHASAERLPSDGVRKSS